MEADSRPATVGLGAAVSKDTALGGPRLALMSCSYHLGTGDPSASFALGPQMMWRVLALGQTGDETP